MLGQLIEHVALVLPPVGSPQQQMRPGCFVPSHPGIMAGGQGIGTVVQGPVQQGTELDAAVAVHTGIGGASGYIFADEMVHDLPLEQLPQTKTVWEIPRYRLRCGRRQCLVPADPTLRRCAGAA